VAAVKIVVSWFDAVLVLQVLTPPLDPEVDVQALDPGAQRVRRAGLDAHHWAHLAYHEAMPTTV
jgi:hypothetical protein